MAGMRNWLIQLFEFVAAKLPHSVLNKVALEETHLICKVPS
jgi:hypothetical protein